MTESNKIADERVTPMRLAHILDKFPKASIEQIGDIIKAVLKDVIREAKDEIINDKMVKTAIGKKTARLFKGKTKDEL